MQRPTLTWIGYNLWRLVAVIFLCWALAAQFIALANDIEGYSDHAATTFTFTPVPTGDDDAQTINLSSSTSTAALTRTSSTVLTVAVASPTTLNNTSSILTTSQVQETSTPVIPPSTSSMTGEEEGTEPTGLTLLTGLPSTSTAAAPIAPGIKREVPVVGSRTSHKRSNSGNESYIGTSSIPNQFGGVFFVLSMRLIIAVVILSLIFAQVGWPEKMLYQHTPWLGPQSTPLFLGSLQFFEKTSTLIPAWVLMGIGLINASLGMTLVYLGRRLPKNPPPPLYFSLATRPLFWTAPPTFYRQITHPNHHETENAEQDAGSRIDDEEKKQTMSNNSSAYSGMADDVESLIEPVPPMPDTPQLRQMGLVKVEHDVRKGGYPTFSGGSVNQPGRQVPAGVIEQSSTGEVIRYLGANGQAAVQPVMSDASAQQDQTGPLAIPAEMRKARQSRSARSARQSSQIQKHPFAATSIREGDAGTVDNNGENQSRRPEPNPSRKSARIPPPQQLPTPPKARRQTMLNPIDEQSATKFTSEQSNVSTSKKSLQRVPSDRASQRSFNMAASTIGPQFPLPPARLDNGPKSGAHKRPKPSRTTSTSTFGDQRLSQSPSASSTPHSPAQEYAATLSRAQVAKQHQRAHIVRPSGANGRNLTANVDGGKPDALGNKAVSEVGLALSGPDASTSCDMSPVETSMSGGQRKEILGPIFSRNVANQELKRSATVTGSDSQISSDTTPQPLIRSASIPRPTGANVRMPSSPPTPAERPVQAVRFDLSPVTSSSLTSGTHSAPVSPVSIPPDSAMTTSRSRSFRIPGTNLRIGLPDRSSAPRSPIGHRVSLDSGSSSETSEAEDSDNDPEQLQRSPRRRSTGSTSLVSPASDAEDVTVAKSSGPIDPGKSKGDKTPKKNGFILGGSYLSGGGEL